MRFTNLTRAVEIGANCYLLEIDGRRIVLDAGMHPQNTGQAALPDFSLVADHGVEAVVISHAHQDHIGALPALLRRQSQARVFLTEPTRLLADVMLHNSVNVMLRQRENPGLADYPLFTHREVDRAVRRCQALPLHQPFTLDGERATGQADDVPLISFHDAGHILGSAGVLVRHRGRRLFYTGDVNFDHQTISRGAHFPVEKLDVLIVECTRGDSPTPHGHTRAAELHRLTTALAEALQRGCVLIPVFALGKTQELLAMLHGMFERGQLPRVPVYIGGLGARITEIYDRFMHTTPRLLPDLDLMEHVKPLVVSGDGPELVVRPNRIYAVSSGMMTENTLSNSLARRLADDRANSIFFIGYADPQTPAGRLRAAAPGDLLQLDPAFPEVELRCQVRVFNFSGHATRDSLVAFARRTAPDKVLLVHGDPPAIEWMRVAIAAELPASEVIVPQPGVSLEL